MAFLYHGQFEAQKSVSEFVDGMLPVLFDVMRHIKYPVKLVNLFDDRSVVRGFCLLVKVNPVSACIFAPSLDLCLCMCVCD